MTDQQVSELAIQLAKARIQLELLDGSMRRAIRLLRKVEKQSTTAGFCATLLDDCLRGAGLVGEIAPREPKDAA